MTAGERDLYRHILRIEEEKEGMRGKGVLSEYISRIWAQGGEADRPP
jgi:hypothetical protein